MAMTETETEKAYETFFRDFQDENGDFKYVNKINQMIIENQRSLIIQYDDLIQMDGIIMICLVAISKKFQMII